MAQRCDDLKVVLRVIIPVKLSGPAGEIDTYQRSFRREVVANFGGR